MRSIDKKLEIEYNYTYENGRIVRATQVDISVSPKQLVSSIEYAYNKEGYLYKKIVNAGNTSVVYRTEYPENANPVTKLP